MASNGRSGQDGIGTSDVNDSDEFLQEAIRARGPERDYSQKIESLLKQMTVKEKVGQMTQLTLEMIASGHDQSIQIDPAKLQKAIGQYGVGSILNCYDQALTPDKWQDLVTQIQAAAKKTRLGIPVIYGIDMSMVPTDYSFPDLAEPGDFEVSVGALRQRFTLK